jgi:hypothetical protein
MRIVCPSGFAGQARKLRGSEIQTIADRLEEDATVADGTTTIAPLLGAVWLETTDSGPYPFISEAEGLKPDWSRMIKADAISALFQVRIGSFRDGHLYEFPLTCPACKQRFNVPVNLPTDILDKAKPMPRATIEAIRTGAPLIAHLSDGREVKFRLPTMADDLPAAKIRKQLVRAGKRQNDGATVVDQVAMMITSVEGESHMDPRRTWLWARDLDLDEIYGLAEQFDAQSGGYDTIIHAKCANCKTPQEVDLPLGRTFLDPRRRSPERDEMNETEDPTETTTPSKTTSSSSSEMRGSA